MRKKITLMLGVILILGAAAISLALFTSKESKNNEFKVGNIKIGIEENFNENSNEVNNLTTKPVQKEVWIKNTGQNYALVRVIINPQWDEVKNKDGDIISPITSASNEVQLNFSNNEGNYWIKGNDGYYYYNKVLKPGEITSNLLESVQLKGNIEENEKKKYENRKLTVNVSSEAIQIMKKYVENDVTKYKINGYESENKFVDIIEKQWNENDNMGNVYNTLVNTVETYIDNLNKQ